MRKILSIALLLLLFIVMLVSCEDDPRLSEESNSLLAVSEITTTPIFQSEEVKTGDNGGDIQLPMDQFN